ncbi:MAG TPA: lipid-A-disaccharide synthase [Abditibacteriaceae bacterium]|jgi:lipid-A-disaccharide synthase
MNEQGQFKIQNSKFKILFIAGDVSGDIHTSLLMREVASRHPEWKLVAVGGAQMQKAAREAGGEVLGDTSTYGVIGFVPSLLLAPRLLKLWNRIQSWIVQAPPDVVVLCDWGAFNGRLLPFLKAQNIPTLYYFPPRSWQQQGEGGLGIAPFVSKVATPFEWSARRLKEVGCDAEWVGHPLLEIVTPSKPIAELRREFGADENSKLIALLPGSRALELRYIAPHLARSARLLQQRNSQQTFRFVVALASGGTQRAARYFDENFQLVEGRTSDVLLACDAAIVKSGTATLEAAVAGVPQVVVYDVPAAIGLQWKLTGLSRKIPLVAMPNIILGRPAVKELLGPACRAHNIVPEVEKLLIDETRRQKMRNDYAQVRRALGSELPKGATLRTAEILEELVC